MSFVVVKGELCSCICNFVSVKVENRVLKREIEIIYHEIRKYYEISEEIKRDHIR